MLMLPERDWTCVNQVRLKVMAKSQHAAGVQSKRDCKPAGMLVPNLCINFHSDCTPGGQAKDASIQQYNVCNAVSLFLPV